MPDGSMTMAKITACSAATGVMTLGPTTAAESGGLGSCTSAGCFFGPPIPIPNDDIQTSLCIVTQVVGDAAGTASCGDGAVAHLTLTLVAGVYLTADVLPDAGHPGIQPCAICEGGTCRGGVNDGEPCTPATSAIGEGYPTSLDCMPPDPPAYIVGTWPITLDLTTGSVTRTAADFIAQTHVFCGFCAHAGGAFESPPHPCTSTASCTTGGFTRCRQGSQGAFGLSAGGLDARTITETGTPPGSCIADGAARAATLVGAFCIPPVGSPVVNGATNLPGPGAVALRGVVQLLP